MSNQIESTVMNFINDITPIVWVIVAIALIVNGVMMAVGSQESREKAKKSMPWVAIGCFMIVGAVTIAKWVVGNMAF